jgi:two-component system, chemotaxis family, CheB/CheR fusion protein
MMAEEHIDPPIHSGEWEKPPISLSTNSSPPDGSSPPFPVVGIGASAGGLDAFEQFFVHLPPDTGIAFILVQHLSPPHKSILPEILQRYTAMTVSQVTDGIPVQPNCVYVIPPGVDMALRDGHLQLLKPELARGVRLPINFFFLSLAEDLHERAIGIVLSGSGSDGSLGLKGIKAEGGLTLAQAPDTAAYGDMPKNAIAAHAVDFILPPDKMGELILKVIQHQVLTGFEPAEPSLLIPGDSMQQLFSLLRAKTGHDFSLYKQNTIQRRIERRIKVTLSKNLNAYIDYLHDHPEEIEALFREMLIHVTHFFRDPDAFQALVEKVVRPLLTLKQASHVGLRVWVAGCSTGEEAFTLAIAIQEQLEALKIDCPVHIFGTDLDEEAVQVARLGLYPPSISEDVSEERLARFFTLEEGDYQVKKAIRDKVVFATQSVVSDPPFSKMDLISCRNLLIYLEPVLQNQLFPMFHYALNPDGILFLGNSESIGGFSSLFTTLDRKQKIFRRKEVPNPQRYYPRIPAYQDEPQPPAPGIEIKPPTPSKLREWTEKSLLENHAPACVIVDDKHNVLFIHGHTGKYLEPVPGEASANLLMMARPGLKAELAYALHTAAVRGEMVRKWGVLVKTDAGDQPINLTVRPIRESPQWQGFVQVVIEDVPANVFRPVQPGAGEKASNRRITALKQELKDKDAYLQTVIDELEIMNQDLKSSNEELQSTNEEMQSANEELETTKEELQSINEELATINTELQKKNEELSWANNDLFNLLAALEIGTLFLDLDLKIRRFTPTLRPIYNLLPSDAGRPIGNFVSQLGYDHLVEDIQQVLETLVPKAFEVRAKDHTWYLVSIKPYRTLENVIDGVVITFVNITQQKKDDQLRRMGTILQDSNDAITLQGFSGKILAWNRGATQMYGWNEAEALSMNSLDLIPEDKRAEARSVFERLAQGEAIRSFETQRVTRDGHSLDVWMTLTALVDEANRPVGIATTERDITGRKRSGSMDSSLE